MLNLLQVPEMKDNVKFYAAVFAGVLAVVWLSVAILGGYGLLLDCVLVGALSCLSNQ